jgi:hypothetical protein
MQSWSTRQAVPLAQRAGLHTSPQSTPVSLPFFTPSMQVGAEHSSAPQTPDAQSVGTTHCSPIGQGVHEPPQSTSLSSKSMRRLLQLAGMDSRLLTSYFGKEQAPVRERQPISEASATT